MKRKMHLSLFLISFVIMGLEMTATRLIAPTFGNTVYTWGIVISLFLVGSSIGYVWGGRCGDHPKKDGFVLLFFFLSIVFIALAIPLKSWLFPHLTTLSSVMGTTAGVFVLYFIPNLLLSALVPIFTQNALEQKLSGVEIGNLHTSSALGSVFGTLVATFLLIPSFAITTILVFLNVLLFIGFLLYFYGSKNTPSFIYIIALACLFSPYLMEPEKYDSLLYHKTSLYHDVYVYSEMNEEGEEIRTLTFGQNGTLQGSMNMSQPEKHQYDYSENIAQAGAILSPSAQEVFMLGHGVGTLTSHFEREGVSILTAELDPEVEKVSRAYFGYSGDSVVIGDGRHILQQQESSTYDVVILDAFKNTSGIPFHLVTQEFFQLVSEKNTKYGILLINAVGTPKEDELLSAMYSTLQSVYPYVYPLGGEDDAVAQNVLFVASKTPQPVEKIPSLELLSLDSGETITDEDAQLKELQ